MRPVGGGYFILRLWRARRPIFVGEFPIGHFSDRRAAVVGDFLRRGRPSVGRIDGRRSGDILSPDVVQIVENGQNGDRI